ncbi:MAG: V-type ATP synthase subunit D [Candidatus Methanofastidiosum methylothiophilum]|jgi:V/A-type H+-transporting ATPase subunit D|uniref:A-type ATP synthase subunit D n=1 Tax=Candidatus Methanofastidiosum methylothiophilum TaxID=1705564 RepID=A0A150JJP2_9EURY|nr:MAG: V-type ATP synthase subunit D [Candidatus Methanofastidiosum methylthiophilus]OQC51595.1 MAG: V-type ATP synthase subunit D [Euryarchaeota archaeon ADurb.Bin023]HNV94022.1 V-type ATP synthase subunit D [Methanofastidiosum sp.]KYC57450.1 MAG: V-type ATP synthase subunit D [Candidatus Methanofastidiosum methylthiophilus]KYC58237.1 MAG: V-type ATP synthase subunit D [Candidatus Methanofastidiosum methylthiophilus]
MPQIKPTRSELIKLRRKIKLSKAGYGILKKKRDGLIFNLFDFVKDAKEAQETLEESYDVAKKYLGMTITFEGNLAVSSCALIKKGNPKFQLDSKNIMGVKVPQVSNVSFRTGISERGYSILSTSSKIDETVEEYEKVLKYIIKAAEAESTLKKLLNEIEITKRRVNALESKIIPRLESQKKFIDFRLEELERENKYRLKMIKDKKSNKVS